MRNNCLRVLGGGQHDHLTVREEAEVPVVTKSAVRAQLTGNPASVCHPPVAVNVMPGPVEAVQRFLPLTDVWWLADVDTWKQKTFTSQDQTFSVGKKISSPSKRTRGRRRNMSLQDLKGTTLVQFLPHTLAQAECQISGSLEVLKPPRLNRKRAELTCCHMGGGGLTARRCKIRGRPETAAPGLAGPDHWTQPNEICTSGSPLAELQTDYTRGAVSKVDGAKLSARL